MNISKINNVINRVRNYAVKRAEHLEYQAGCILPSAAVDTVYTVMATDPKLLPIAVIQKVGFDGCEWLKLGKLSHKTEFLNTLAYVVDGAKAVKNAVFKTKTKSL